MDFLITKGDLKMSTCMYCAAEVDYLTASTFYCYFCKMYLSKNAITENGERKDNTIDCAPCRSYLKKDTANIIKLKTIELLYLLKYAHEDKKEIEPYSTNNDKLIQVTRKIWVLENIIAERIGYYPKEVTDAFLDSYMNKIREGQKRQMISKEIRTMEKIV